MYPNTENPRNNNGVVLAEFALILPVALVIIFSIIEFGQIFYTTNSLNQIGRSIAREVSVNPNKPSSELVSDSKASSYLSNVNNLTVTISPEPGNSRNFGEEITVKLEYIYKPILSGLLSIFSPDGNGNIILTVRNKSTVEVRA